MNLMKHTIFMIITVVLLCTGFSGCKGKSSDPADGSFGKDPSYTLGMNIGSSLKYDSIYPDWDQFLQGMKDVLYGNETRLTMEEASKIFNEALKANYEKVEAEKAKKGEERKQAGIDFLEKNKQKPGIITTESGLQYEVITQGNGPKPTAQDTVKVNYKGTLIDGTEFDSSYSRGEPSEFALNMVIKGWTEGIQLMNVGSKYKFFIPENIAYGAQDRGQNLPSYSTLIFEVELLDIVKK